MNLHITTIDKSLKFYRAIHGSIALTGLTIWPDWYKPRSKKLMTWEDKNLPNRVRYVSIEDGKQYTFKDLVGTIQKNFPKGTMYYNNHRVTIDIPNDGSYKNVRFCDELVHLMEFPRKNDYTGVTTGNAVDKESLTLTFNATNKLFLTCSQLDINKNYVNDQQSKVLAILPIKLDTIKGNPISWEFPQKIDKPLQTYTQIYELSFIVEDSEGRSLPIQEMIMDIKIK